MSEKKESTADSEAKSRAVAEDSREEEWTSPSFVQELFLGNFRLDLIHPYPAQSEADKAKTDAYLEKLEAFLRENVNPTEIDRTGEIPAEVLDGLRKIGVFGLKIPEEYGGVGLSQIGYGRAIELITSWDGNLTALISAHQSIGVPQPLKMFGTPEQKKKYLPRLAAGAVSAFALTEKSVGSDPARVTTTAVESEDGSEFILNGEKLWCTNGTIAELLVVMARTKPKLKNGREIPQITAFIVEASSPGVEVTHRCRFMGLKAIQNAVIKLDNVRVPKENILWAEGKGLKLALMTLNTGRLTLPMSATAGAKICTEITRKWASERVQWGAPIGKHEAVAKMLGEMAANAFAIEAMAELSCLLADRGSNDIRLEAAIAKLWTTEVGWKIVDDTLQVRGGRGYETEESLKARGEVSVPVERLMRDFRINRIFEGSSEIMKLFIAREAVDTHLAVAGELIDPSTSSKDRAAAFARAGAFYATWLPKQYVGWGHWPRYGEFGKLAPWFRYIERGSKKLARNMFYAMSRYQAKLERKQALLGRFVDIGAELFAMAATCVRADALRAQGGPEGEKAVRLASIFCRQARMRVDNLFHQLFNNVDASTYRFAQEVLRGEHAWLEEGVFQMIPDGARLAPEPPATAPAGEAPMAVPSGQ
ncbi:MAG: acyl-CoA dehydrogenase family protein [Gemmatimonadota bacterium]|jgi:alkylation response protein AidB-like acyl-CoA dehydrogenase|nr:acyl-CoA dehydrogenase family protein [Gemmatimonadota bacterium]